MTASVTLQAGALVFAGPKDPRTLPILQALPQRSWDPHERVWRIALTPDNVPGCRSLYTTRLVTFSDDAVAALKALGARPGLGKASPDASIQIAPEVVPSCRSLEATTSPLPGIAP